MTSNEYYKLTEEAGNFYRSKKFQEALNCCNKIANEIESLKNQIPNLNELNKDFILYSVFLMFANGVNDEIKNIFNKILSANIITKERLREDIDHSFDFDGEKDIENTKNIGKYLIELEIYDEREIEEIINGIEDVWNVSLDFA